jgi:hypothetical protein
MGDPGVKLLLKLVLLAWILAEAPVFAHHSFAMFDWNQTQTVKGAVKAIEWTSPHVWIWVDAGSESPTVYGFETVSPGELTRFSSWTRSSLKVGDKVTVVFAPLRSGRAGVR